MQSLHSCLPSISISTCKQRGSGSSRRQHGCPKAPQQAATHRQPPLDVADDQEGVVVEVAHHGCAAPQLRGSAVPVVVVGEGAVVHHGGDVGENTLWGEGPNSAPNSAPASQCAHGVWKCWILGGPSWKQELRSLWVLSHSGHSVILWLPTDPRFLHPSYASPKAPSLIIPSPWLPHV